jgi:hypothetical protein
MEDSEDRRYFIWKRNCAIAQDIKANGLDNIDLTRLSPAQLLEYREVQVNLKLEKEFNKLDLDKPLLKPLIEKRVFDPFEYLKY